MSDRAWKTLAQLAGTLTAVGAGMLIYGALVESNRLTVEHHTLNLPGWPDDLKDFRIALLGDFHLSTVWSVDLAKRAVAAAMAEAPDMVVLIGDMVTRWKPDSIAMIGEILEPLRLLQGDVLVIPGNHDYLYGETELLQAILAELDIEFLRNRALTRAGIHWIGIGSARWDDDDIDAAFADVPPDTKPRIVLWHEPDVVDLLPSGCTLQLSGHGHGGQFRLPFGIVPMHAPLGQKYPGGYYPQAPTPLFVTRGVGTTGPPSRFLCPPEVAILKLVPG